MTGGLGAWNYIPEVFPLHETHLLHPCLADLRFVEPTTSYIIPIRISLHNSLDLHSAILAAHLHVAGPTAIAAARTPTAVADRAAVPA